MYADELDSQTTDNQDFIVLDDDEGWTLFMSL